ncbi:MAG: hypothetical protein V4697_01610, partial [Patescibacteria group bacterium]
MKIKTRLEGEHRVDTYLIERIDGGYAFVDIRKLKWESKRDDSLSSAIEEERMEILEVIPVPFEDMSLPAEFVTLLGSKDLCKGQEARSWKVILRNGEERVT